MKIAVVGPGALGCLFAALMARAGHQVWLVDHRPERARRIEARGIELHDQQGRQCLVPVRATVDVARIGEAHLVFLCVKSEAAEGAARRVLPILGNDGLLITLQNGIAHHLRLTGLLNKAWVLGVTAQGSNLLGPGVVRHGGSGPTSVGFLAEAEPLAESRLQQAVDLLNRAGIPTAISHDILADAWNKLIVNAGINALTALEDCTNGELLSRPGALATLEAAVREAARVALASGIKVAPDPVAMTIEVCRTTAKNSSSMRQDIQQGRRTEVEAINGMIVRQAAALGISVPTNGMLLSGIKTLEGRAENHGRKATQCAGLKNDAK